MKKMWKTPACLTMAADKLAMHIKAAARSGCDFWVMR